MPTAREGANIWFLLRMGWVKSPKDLRRVLGSKYFWQDSFLTQFNRWIGCKLFGHRNVHNVADPGQPNDWECFNCYRHIDKGD